MKDFRSLEHKIRDMYMEAAVARNTALRQKVENVGRPQDDNKNAETSKLAKQGEIKTKIIDEENVDEAKVPDNWEENSKSKRASTAAKVAKDSMDHDNTSKIVQHVPKITEAANVDVPAKQEGDAKEVDPKKIKGGKTEVILNPKTDDKTEDDNEEDQASKKALKQQNKAIGQTGAKGVKEEMDNINFGLPKSLIDAVRNVVEGHSNKTIDGEESGSKEEKAMSKKVADEKKAMKEDSATQTSKSKDPLSLDNIAGYSKPQTQNGAAQPDDAPTKTSMQNQSYKKFSRSNPAPVPTALEATDYSAKKAAAGKDIGKPGKQFSKIADKAAAKYGSKAAGERVAGAILKNLRKEEVESVEEALKGNQKKIDANHNGKIDAEDFKILRKKKGMKEEVKSIDEGNPANKEKKNAAAIAVGAENRDAQHVGTRGMRMDVADKIRGREKLSGKDRQHYGEEVEQIDELSKDTLKSYIKKSTSGSAPNSALNLAAHAAHKMTRRKGSDVDDAIKLRDKAEKRGEGIVKAASKLAKEDVEFSAEELARIEEIAKKND